MQKTVQNISDLYPVYSTTISVAKCVVILTFLKLGFDIAEIVQYGKSSFENQKFTNLLSRYNK